jgi:hypothetical protein
LVEASRRREEFYPTWTPVRRSRKRTEKKKKFNLNYFFELLKKRIIKLKTPNGRESAVNRALDGSTHPD